MRASIGTKPLLVVVVLSLFIFRCSSTIETETEIVGKSRNSQVDAGGDAENAGTNTTFGPIEIVGVRRANAGPAGHVGGRKKNQRRSITRYEDVKWEAESNKEEFEDPAKFLPSMNRANFAPTQKPHGIWNDLRTMSPGIINPLSANLRREDNLFFQEFGKLDTYPKENIMWMEPEMLSVCWKQAMLAKRFAYSPSCSSTGTFTEKQCFLQRCWCVFPDGTPMPDEPRFYFHSEALDLNCAEKLRAFVAKGNTAPSTSASRNQSRLRKVLLAEDV